MHDRLPEPGKEGRVRFCADEYSPPKLLIEDGHLMVEFEENVIEGVMEHADNAAQSGSVYDKSSVLPDDVCDTLGVDRETAEPKDAFLALRKYAQGRESTFQKLMTGRFI